ncbi:MAG: hypothetical protein GY950_10205, partial [bacterium]|nr:hypothetical protein [bacterium]
ALIFWGPLLCLILLWIISYLSKEPLLKRLQISLTRKAVRKKTLHPILETTARKFKKWRFKPQLLEAVTAEQRQKAFYKLAALPLNQSGDTKDRAVITSAARLTRLHTRLLTLPPAPTVNLLQAAVYWQETHMRLKTLTKTNTETIPPWLEKLSNDLTLQIDCFVTPLLPYKDPHQLEPAKEREAGFDSVSLAVDLLHLAALGDNDIAGYVLGAKIPLKKRETLVAQRLAASTAVRRAFLDKNRSRLENRFHLFHSDSLPNTMDQLPLLGRLALLIALDLAALARVPETALAFIDSIETLDFVLHLLQPARPHSSNEPSGQEKILQLINGLPHPTDYRFCAQLTEKETNQRIETWQQAKTFTSAVTTADLDLAQSRYRALYQAAGPSFADEKKS